MNKHFSAWLGTVMVAAACSGFIAGCGDSGSGSARAPEEAGTPDALPHAPGPDARKTLGAGGGAGDTARTPDGRAAPDAAVPRLPVGASCSTDADCGGLTCLKSTDTVPTFGGGPAGGYCTRECTPASTDAGALNSAQATCSAINPLADCVRLDASTLKAYCFLSCLPGQFPQAYKCGGRADLACYPLSSSLGFCTPTCSTDADCGSRKCDLGSGYCTDPKPAGAPMGTPCGPGSALEAKGGKCDGFCLDASPSPNGPPLMFCSGQCVLGEFGCGTRLNASGVAVPGPGVCAIPQSPASSTSDSAFCAQACDCDGDCLDPDTVCAKYADPPIPGLKYGACIPPTLFGVPFQGKACSDSGTDAGTRKPDAGSVRDAGGAGGATDARAD